MLKKIALFFAFFWQISLLQAESLEDYTRVYHKQCATCHGNNGDGQGRAGASLTPAPTDFTSSESKQKLTLDKIILAIREGLPGSAMSAYGRRFDEKMLKGLAVYIQTQFMVKKTASSKVVMPGDDGQAIYVKHCSACHGDKGNTAVWARNALNPAPRNFIAAQAKEELSVERMITSVTYGRPGTAMMSFQKRLNNDEIKAVVGFIRQTFMQIESEQITEPNVNIATPKIAIDAVNMNLPFPENLRGDKIAGKKFFQNNCFTCHGKNGDGKGPRASFNIPRPRNFTSPESRRILNRPRLFKGISHGKARTVMPAWSTVLSDQQIADIAEYVFQNFVQVTTPDQKKKS